MIIEPQISNPTEQAVNQALDFYAARYPEVHAVDCIKCKQTIAIQVHGQVEGLKAHRNGVTVIPIDDRLMSSRIRHDLDHEGLEFIGYECGACGSNTLLGEIEEAAAPDRLKTTTIFSVLPHEEAAFVSKIRDIQASAKPISTRTKDGHKKLGKFIVKKVR